MPLTISLKPSHRRWSLKSCIVASIATLFGSDFCAFILAVEPYEERQSHADCLPSRFQEWRSLRTKVMVDMASIAMAIICILKYVIQHSSEAASSFPMPKTFTHWFISVLDIEITKNLDRPSPIDKPDDPTEDLESGTESSSGHYSADEE